MTIGGQIMAKEIPADKLKVAVTALNSIIEEGKIKTVARKKSEVVAEFKAKMLGFITEEKTDDIPDAAVDFFNEFIADDDASEASSADDKKTDKKDSKKDKKEPKEKKEKKGTGITKVGILDCIFSTIKSEGPIDKAGILKVVAAAFPDRDAAGIKNTINCQLTGTKRPWRLEKSRSATFKMVDGKYSFVSAVAKDEKKEEKKDAKKTTAKK
jgi:hypothetical protein